MVAKAQASPEVAGSVARAAQSGPRRRGHGGGAALGAGAAAGRRAGGGRAAAVGGGGRGRGAAPTDAEGAARGEPRAPGAAAAAERAGDGGAAGGGRDRRERGAAAGAVAEVTAAHRDTPFPPPPVISPLTPGTIAPGGSCTRTARRCCARPLFRAAPRPRRVTSAAAMEPRGAGEAVAAPARPLFGGCWSCRVLSGSALLLAALWIYQGPRRSMKRGVPPSLAAIAQITFAISVGAWGVVILVDPVGKQLRKEP
ncbi:translation initiation factor IF-2 isoform X1 [Rissa tridactyla]|uniref:translation initiation factor IF-2 isoform X1 n=1 Tax=Rissa tridactyla TaxID=75485 RepID=UPI0023BA52D1|nr:translation initiation factor IF-2 isoform X1 [Rissa tridactyla]